MVTLKEVAKHAGVSTATVSRVINHSGRVAPRTREKILMAIQQLNYVPDGVARSMAMQRTGILGMVVPDIRNISFAEIYLGASEYAVAHGYIMWLVDSHDSVTHEREAWLQLRRIRVDGVLIAPIHSRANRDLWETSPVPLCFVDREPERTTVDFVGMDNFQGVYEATKFLVEHRHTRIGIIAGPQANSAGRERLSGFYAAMQEMQIPVLTQNVVVGDFHEHTGYLLGRQLLAQWEPPTGIIVCNNLMTLGLLQGIADTPSARLGHTIAVIGFDDFPLATIISPPLSVISRPMREVGARAAAVLIARLSEPHRPVSRTILGPHLILRGSERFPTQSSPP